MQMHATTTEKRLVLTMDRMMSPGFLEAILQVFGGVLGGGATVEFVRRWLEKKKKQRELPLEFTARILDDGDQMRTQLLATNATLVRLKDEAMERAHQAEIRLAVVDGELERLRLRLERKDEQVKAMRRQIRAVGQTPVVGGDQTQELPDDDS